MEWLRFIREVVPEAGVEPARLAARDFLATSAFAAGASAVQVGTAIFNDPHAPIRVRDELGEELRVREIASPADVVGIAHTRIPGRDR